MEPKPKEVRNFFATDKRPNIFSRLRKLGEKRREKAKKAKITKNPAPPTQESVTFN